MEEIYKCSHCGKIYKDKSDREACERLHNTCMKFKETELVLIPCRKPLLYAETLISTTQSPLKTYGEIVFTACSSCHEEETRKELITACLQWIKEQEQALTEMLAKARGEEER